MSNIGDRIKLKRKELGLTQAELGEKLGVSDRAVSKWEQGDGDPNLSIIPDIARILGVDLNFLLLGKEEETITLDDMDSNKRRSYLIKKDDVDGFKKYDYISSLFERSKRIDGRVEIYPIKKSLWDEILAAGARQLFCLALDAFLEKNKKNPEFWHTAAIPEDYLDTFIKAVVDVDRADVLKTIAVRYFSIEQNKNRSRNNQKHLLAPTRNAADTLSYTMSAETLEYFFIKRKESPNCFMYIVRFGVKDVPFENVCHSINKTEYVVTYLEMPIIDLAIKYKEYSVIEQFVSLAQVELKYALQIVEERSSIASNTYLTHGGGYYANALIIEARIFTFSKMQIEGLMLAGNVNLATELNNYNKSVYDGLFRYFRYRNLDFVKSIYIYTEAEIDRFMKLHSDIPDREKIKVKCVEDGILVISEARKVRDLELLREILNESIYNPCEIACRAVATNNYRSLFTYLVDTNRTEFANLLLSGKELRIIIRIKELLKTLSSDSNKIDQKVLGKFEGEALNQSFGIDTSNMTPEIEDQWNAAVSRYCIEKMYQYILQQKEVIFESVKSEIEQEDEKKRKAKECSQAKKGLSRDYFDEMLSSFDKKSRRLFILDLCSLFDTILKYDYECEGEDLFGRMNDYYKRFAPSPRTKDDGWGYTVNDDEYELSVIMPWKKTWELMCRLRMERNNIAHPEQNEKVKDLTQEELVKCLEFVFSINKEGK